jgi:hypothetical protein
VSIRFYMDANVPFDITAQLRRRGIDVVTAQDEGREEDDDSDLLDRATDLDRVMFTRDDDFLAIATSRQRSGDEFAGIAYAHQIKVPLGRCVTDLVLLARCCTQQETQNQIVHLPL